MKYQSILHAVQTTPWAIVESKLAEIVEFLTLKASGVEFSEDEVQARTRSRAASSDREFDLRGSTAVIPVFGTIANKSSLLSAISGASTIAGMRRQLRAALADEEVSTIVLDVDSPGGAVDGLPEFAEEVRRSRDVKPIVASVNTFAASAAYWLASQATRIEVSPSGELGSIGVFAAHTEISKKQEKDGIKTTVIRAGKHKIEANPWEPLSKEARAELQKAVDEYYEMFIEDVAAGRGVPVSLVEDKFGQGKTFRAKESLERGMADEVSTFEDTVTNANIRAAMSKTRERVQTIRDFEAALRDLGFTRSEATLVASRGFQALENQRDADSGTDTGEEADFLRRAAEILKI